MGEIFRKGLNFSLDKCPERIIRECPHLRAELQVFTALRLAVMICATLVNIQTHTDMFRPATL